MRKFSVIILLAFMSLTCVAQSGPFGFEKGMTKDQVIKLIGQKNIDPRTLKGDVLAVKTAPKANPAFGGYMLMFSPQDGLVRVAAVGPVTSTNDNGSQLKTSYDAVLQGLTHDFGEPTSKIDECNGPAFLCKRDDNWMMTLYGKQRRMESTWYPEVPTQAMRDAGVHVITLRVSATSLNSGFLTCDFELEGYEHYAKSKVKAETPAAEKEKDADK